MYNISEAYKQRINETAYHHLRGIYTPKNATFKLDITDKICGEVSKYNQCISNAETLGIGSVYQGELNFTLRLPLSNMNLYLYEAKVLIDFGLELSDGSVEWVHNIAKSKK